MSTIVYLGLGSNLGDPLASLGAGIAALQQEPGIREVEVSGFYCGAPVGDAYQGQPDYVNAVARLETDLAATELLARLMRIEREAGRSREVPFAARTLDMDILLYGEAIIDEPQLTVPHPRMHERAFVLQPLFDLWPDGHIPGRGPVAALREMCEHQSLMRLEV